MPGDVGLVAGLVKEVFTFFAGEDGYAEFKRRQELAAIKAKAADALKRGDWDALRVHTAELERLSSRA
jgi:hypothetical protein